MVSKFHQSMPAAAAPPAPPPAGPNKFQEFMNPSHAQPIESTGGEWRDKLLAQNLNPVNEELDQSARMVGDVAKKAGLAIGAATLICGGGIIPAAAIAIKGIITKCVINGAIDESRKQERDPNSLDGITTAGEWIKHSLKGTAVAGLSHLAEEVKNPLGGTKQKSGGLKL